VVTVNEDYADDPALQEEWLQQDSLSYGGLIAVGIIMVQPFLAASSPDLSAKICVVAFSVTIPLLAALVMVNQQERFRRRRTSSIAVVITRAVAFSGAFTGMVAGFWHIWWIAGVGMAASGIVGVGVHSTGFTRLERQWWARSEEAAESGNTE
jgi:hypothetical protein